MSVIIVTLQADGPEGGSAKICCQSMKPDPFMPATHVLLSGIKGLSWPFAGAWVDVQQWSVPKDTILNWMVGPLRKQPVLTFDKLDNKGQETPHLPGTLPTEDLKNDTLELQELIDEEETQAKLAAQAAEAMKKRKESGADGS